jgi:hypothetical protein
MSPRKPLRDPVRLPEAAGAVEGMPVSLSAAVSCIKVSLQGMCGARSGSQRAQVPGGLTGGARRSRATWRSHGVGMQKPPRWMSLGGRGGGWVYAFVALR